MRLAMPKLLKWVVFFVAVKPYISIGQYNFDAGFLKSLGLEHDNADLSRFNAGASFSPGVYSVSVYINNEFFGVLPVRFAPVDNLVDPAPCFSLSEWQGLGIEVTNTEQQQICPVPTDYVPGAQWRVHMDTQRLNITVPQIALAQSDIFKTPVQSWQSGSNALLLNYNYNYSTNRRSSGVTNSSQYLAVNSGLNLSGIRFRNNSSWTKSEHQNGRYTTLNSYAQKDYHFFQGGELTLGEVFTDGSLFESLPLKGIVASSLDEMVRPEFQNFTPVVRGVVNSQSATVSVKKNGNIIYQESLPSGPFALEGVMNNGGGDYQVEIAESDGSLRSYTQYADSLPALQSKGRVKYNILSGKTNYTSQNNANINQATVFYGVTDNITLYGGVILSDNYHSYNAGIGNTIGGYGAFALDISVSDADVKNDKANSSVKGEALRFSYYKNVEASGTTLGLLAYRYATEDYLDFSEFIQRDSDYNGSISKKNRIEVNLMQNLNEFGNLSLSGNHQTYWGSDRSALNFSLSHNISLGQVSLRSYFSQNKLQNNTTDKTVGAGVSFSLAENGRRYSASNNTNSRNGILSNNLSLSTGLMDNRLNLSASQNWSEQDDMMSGLSLSYTGNRYDFSSSYYNSADSRRLNTNIRGGAFLYGDGAGLSRFYSLDTPLAIVHTPGVSDVKLNRNDNNSTDYFGHAIVGNLQPYQRNQIGIDPSSLKNNFETSNTDMTIIPRKGSVVPVRFEVMKGQRALFDVLWRGKSIPLGAVASVMNRNDIQQTAFFADRGQVYLTGLDYTGKVRVQWGNSDKESCEFEYSLNKNTAITLHRGTMECR